MSWNEIAGNYSDYLDFWNKNLEEESTLTTRHSFIQITKLSNVRGRITYISSHAKQEHLYAVYETTERSYWTELARCSQQEFKKSGVEGKCIEARELIIALPESLFEQGMPILCLDHLQISLRKSMA